MPNRILVVDDDNEVRELIRLVLRNRGYEVYEADSGRIGLAMVDDVAPDLIVLDLMLPEMSGMEVAKQLHANPKLSEIPVLVLSAVGNDKKRSEEFWRQGLHVDEFMAKSDFSPENLLGRVEYLLRRDSYRNANEETAPPFRIEPQAGAKSSPSEARMTMLAPEDVVRQFVESWNTADFSAEYECLSEKMRYGLSKAEYVQRRQEALSDKRHTGTQKVSDVIASQVENEEAVIQITRQDQRGNHASERRETYKLAQTDQGWKIISVRADG